MRRKNECSFRFETIQPLCNEDSDYENCLYYKEPEVEDFRGCKYEGNFNTCNNKEACNEALQKLFKHLRSKYGEED